jgi:alpha-1,2-mannosyltransferase
VLVVGLARAAVHQRRGDDLAGVAVTGMTACLVAPISWVHHLYWVVPALVVLVDVAAGTPVAAGLGSRRPRLARPAAAAAAVLAAGALAGAVVWFFPGTPAGLSTVAGENAYVLLLHALVAGLPGRALPGAPRGVDQARVGASSPAGTSPWSTFDTDR